MRWESFLAAQLRDDRAMAARFKQDIPVHRIGAQIAVRRTALGLSQSRLAERAGVTQRQVSALENGKANVTIHTLSRLARVLGLTVTLSESILTSSTSDMRVADRHGQLAFVADAWAGTGAAPVFSESAPEEPAA